MQENVFISKRKYKKLFRMIVDSYDGLIIPMKNKKQAIKIIFCHINLPRFYFQFNALNQK